MGMKRNIKYSVNCHTKQIYAIKFSILLIHIDN